MEALNEGMYGDREVHNVELDDEGRCIIDIANYRFTYVMGKDGEVYLIAQTKPGSNTQDFLKDIPQVLLDRAKIVAEKVFQEHTMDQEDKKMETFKSANEAEILHTDGEEELERQKWEITDPEKNQKKRW